MLPALDELMDARRHTNMSQMCFQFGKKRRQNDPNKKNAKNYLTHITKLPTCEPDATKAQHVNAAD